MLLFTKDAVFTFCGWMGKSDIHTFKQLVFGHVTDGLVVGMPNVAVPGVKHGCGVSYMCSVRERQVECKEIFIRQMSSGHDGPL